MCISSFLQSLVRKRIVHNNYKKQKNAVIVLQKNVKRMIARKRYCSLKSSVLLVESWWVNILHGRKIQKEYLDKKNRIIYLQSLFRMYVARNNFRKKRLATIVLQKNVKKMIARIEFTTMKFNASKIKIWWLSVLLTKKIRKKFLQQKEAAVKIQAFWRMRQCRKSYSNLKAAVSIIESRRIAKKIRLSYISEREKIIKLQSLFHMRKCRKQFLKLKKASLTIQKTFRSVTLRQKFLKLKLSTVKVQQYYRNYRLMYVQRRNYLIMKTGFVKLQAAWRGITIRQHINLLHKQATIIQTCYRKSTAMKKFSALKSSCIVIQRRYRARQEMKLHSNRYQIMKSSAISIQTVVRRYLTRKKYLIMKAAAVKIQSLCRMISARKKYLDTRNKIVMLQRHYRNILLTKKIRNSYLLQKQQVILLQCHVKKYIARKRYLKVKRSCILVQSVIRMWIQKAKYIKSYETILQSTIVIQSVWRCYRARREYSRKKSAAILLQSYIRAWICRKKFIGLKISVIKIQQLYRASKMRSKEFEAFQEKRLSCIKIQSFWRHYVLQKNLKRRIKSALTIQRCFRIWRTRQLIINQEKLIAESRKTAATVLQAVTRGWLARKRFKQIIAAVKIQAAWRAYLVRRSIQDKKIIAAREKIYNASSDECKKLANRTLKALKIVLGNESVPRVLNAVENLDVCTRLSSVCCEHLENSEGLLILLSLIHCCNRSVPHQQIIKYTLNILLNLTKYQKTINSVWSDESVITILKLMKTYREKECPIFTKCCTVLWIFAQDSSKAEVLKRNPFFVDEVKRSYSLLFKKQREMEKKITSRPSLSASVLNTTMLKRYVANSFEVINIEPDWQLRRCRRKEFSSPLNAIMSLCHALDLKPETSN